jgi:hypothetical protein
MSSTGPPFSRRFTSEYVRTTKLAQNGTMIARRPTRCHFTESRLRKYAIG